MTTDVATLIAQKFIARRDVKAIQRSNGGYSPVTEGMTREGARVPWKMSDLRRHLAGEETFGHYLLTPDDKCKLFAFDIDLEQNAPSGEPDFVGSWVDSEGAAHPFDARESWLIRSHPARTYLKTNLMWLAQTIASTAESDLGIPTAIAYSGCKGVHVYGFTGLMPARDVREGAEIVLEILSSELEATRGKNFYRSTHREELTDPFRNMTVEVFPKQDSLAGKDLGNLMRLPLGKNRKNPKDPTFFIDPNGDWEKMPMIDPVTALTAGSRPVGAVSQDG